MLRIAAGVFAAASMGICLWAPLAYFLGYTDVALCRELFAFGSVGWFIGATVFASVKHAR